MIKYATLGGAQLFVGAAAIFARFALSGAGPVAVSWLRLGIAALVVAAVVLRRQAKTLDARREIVLVVAGVALAVHFAGWIASLEFTSIAIATLLVCTSPIFTAIYDALAQRRAPGIFFWLALGCGVLGMLLVVANKSAVAPIPGHALAGAVLALLGAIAMAVYLTIVRTVRSGLTTLQIVARTYTWAALTLIPLAFVLGEPPPPFHDATAWFGILAMALISQLLGHTAMNNALRHFTPTTVGFSTLLEPVIAAVLAALVFGEALALTTLAGGVVLLGAIGFALRDSMQFEAEPEL